MLAASKLKMSGREKKSIRNKYDISPRKSVTRTFLQISRCSRAKQRQRYCTKTCAERAKLFLFCYLGLLFFFSCVSLVLFLFLFFFSVFVAVSTYHYMILYFFE